MGKESLGASVAHHCSASGIPISTFNEGIIGGSPSSLESYKTRIPSFSITILFPSTVQKDGGIVELTSSIITGILIRMGIETKGKN